MILKMTGQRKLKGSLPPLILPQRDEGLEVKAGELYMVETSGTRIITISVFVRVYKSQYEHYMVIHRDKISSHNSVYISLKNSVLQASTSCNKNAVSQASTSCNTTSVLQASTPCNKTSVLQESTSCNEFCIIPDSHEGTKLRFRTVENDKEEWLDAFQSPLRLSKYGSSISPVLSPVIPRFPLMATLTEMSEIEEPD